MPTRAASLAADTISDDVRLTPSEVATTLEIVYLAIAADHVLSEEELDAFRLVMERLRSVEDSALSGDGYRAAARVSIEPVSLRSLNLVVDAFAASNERAQVDERLRSLAAFLSPSARNVAYKIAYAIGFADLASTDEEFVFDLQLIDALELSTHTTDALVGEVRAIMERGES